MMSMFALFLLNSPLGLLLLAILSAGLTVSIVVLVIIKINSQNKR